MGLLDKGLLGYGGIGGIGGTTNGMQPFEGFDPAALKRQQLKQMLLMAGVGLLGSKENNIGGQIASGLQGGLLGSQAATDNYMKMGLLSDQAKQRKADAEWNAKDRAWTMTERSKKMDEWNRIDDQRKAQQTYVQNMLGPTTGLPVQQTAQARAYQGMGDYGRAAEALVPQIQQPKDLMSIGENSSIFDPNTRTWVPNPNAGTTKPTDDMREYQAAREQGYQGTLQDWIISGKKAGASQTTIDMKGQSAYAQERGKGFATQANEIDKEERAARDAITAMSSMQKQMADPNFYSGFGASQLQAARRAIVAIGGDPNSVSSMETFAAQAKQLALASMGGSLGTGFSNADRDFVTGQVPGLENTPQGNVALIEVSRRIAERKIEIAKMARAYEMQHDQLDANFLQELAAWSEQNPVFPDVPQQQQKPKDASEMTDEELLRSLGGQ